MKLKSYTAVVTASLLSFAPLSSMAEGGFYGSVRIGVGASDTNLNDTVFEVANWASRMGYAGDTEISAGLTVFGKYEFGVATDSANSIDDIITRKAYVGFEGGFGKVWLGQDYHTFYNHVIAPVDKPWWGGCTGCFVNPGRTASALSYAGEFGGISAGATVYLERTANAATNTKEDHLDGVEIGGTFNIGQVVLGAGIQDLADNDDPSLGVAAATTFGPVDFASNLTVNGDSFGIDSYAAYSDFYLNVGLINYKDVVVDGVFRDDTLFGMTFGYTLDLGENTLAWFEASASDSDATGAGLETALRAALKYDWQ